MLPGDCSNLSPKTAHFECRKVNPASNFNLELRLSDGVHLHQVEPISKRSRLWSYGYFKDALPARHWDGRARDDRNYSGGVLSWWKNASYFTQS